MTRLFFLLLRITALFSIVKRYRWTRCFLATREKASGQHYFFFFFSSRPTLKYSVQAEKLARTAGESESGGCQTSSPRSSSGLSAYVQYVPGPSTPEVDSDLMVPAKKKRLRPHGDCWTSLGELLFGAFSARTADWRTQPYSVGPAHEGSAQRINDAKKRKKRLHLDSNSGRSILAFEHLQPRSQKGLPVDFFAPAPKKRPSRASRSPIFAGQARNQRRQTQPEPSTLASQAIFSRRRRPPPDALSLDNH